MDMSFKWWAEEVEKATNGRVKVKLFFGGTLAPAPDQYAAGVSGLCDVTTMLGGFNPGIYERFSQVAGLPFIAPKSDTGMKVYRDLMKKFPEIVDEFSEVKFLYFFVSTANGLHTPEKPLRTLEDVQGVKLASRAPVLSDVLEALGAVPVAMGPPDTYMAIEKGVVDGTIFSWGGLGAFKLEEVTKYHTNVALASGGAAAYVMNLDTWNSLPPDLQATIEGVNRRAEEWVAKAMDEEDQLVIDKAKQMGDELISLAPAELDKWLAKCSPIAEAWIKKMEGKGFTNARAIYNEALKLSKAYSK